MSKYYELSDETISIFNEVFNKKTFPMAVRFQFIGCETQKQLIKISKMPEHFEFLLGKELLVIINEDLLRVFDDESVNILIEQELDKVSISIDTGKIKLVKPDLTTFSSIVSKYGIEKVAKANQVEELYDQQKKDGNDEFIA
jgi:hypothetical protein